MDIKTFADLAKVADICRKKGIETIKLGPDSVEFKLKEAPAKGRRRGKQTSPANELPQEDTLTEEDMLFWSSAGLPTAPAAEGN